MLFLAKKTSAIQIFSLKATAFLCQQTETEWTELKRILWGNNVFCGGQASGSNGVVIGDGNDVTGNENGVTGNGNAVTGNNNNVSGDLANYTVHYF